MHVLAISIVKLLTWAGIIGLDKVFWGNRALCNLLRIVFLLKKHTSKNVQTFILKSYFGPPKILFRNPRGPGTPGWERFIAQTYISVGKCFKKWYGLVCWCAILQHMYCFVSVTFFVGQLLLELQLQPVRSCSCTCLNSHLVDLQWPCLEFVDLTERWKPL